mgnify:CR=1 FL=1
MHNLALALHAQGHHVTGSDDRIYDPSRSRLASAGLLPPKEGWFPGKIVPELDAVILGKHAHADNPELKAANERGLPVFSFPEFVYEQARDKQRIVVAGSHGKTTITAMLMHALKAAGREFDYLVGAHVPGFDQMVKLSKTAPFILLEGDEYPASSVDPTPKFLHYHPHILILTGIAWDHINAFPSPESYELQFEKLLQTVPKAGTVIYNKDEKNLKELVSRVLDKEAHYAIPYHAPKYKYREGQPHIKFRKKYTPVQLYGKHNMANYMAAFCLLEELAMQHDEIKSLLSAFKGAGLRMQNIYEDDQLVIIRDYAHAPSKVSATVEAVQERYKHRNLVAGLELSTYSSLNKTFLPQYADSLRKVKDAVIFIDQRNLEVKRLENIDEAFLREAFNHKTLELTHNPADFEARLRSKLTGEDALLLMSSGNLGGLNPEAFEPNRPL